MNTNKKINSSNNLSRNNSLKTNSTTTTSFKNNSLKTNSTTTTSFKNNSKGTVNKVVNAGKSNPITALIIIIIIVVLLYVLGNYIYDFYQKNNSVKVLKESLLQGINDARNEYEVSGSKMPNSNYSNEYSLSFWMYVDDYSYRQGQRKFILRRGDLSSEVNPEIYLHPNHNTLQVNVSLMTDSKGEALPHQNVNSSPEHANSSNINTSTTNSETINDNASATTTTVKEGFTTCDCDKVKTSEDILNNVNSNNPNVSQNYNNNVFDLISGNEIPKLNTHNKLLNNVVEQFADEPSSNNTTNNSNSNNKDCECDTETEKVTTESDRQAFEDKCGKCFVEDFPLQKWVHVVISQYNQVVDIYVDGKLRSSCVMPGFPMLTQENLVLSPDNGFSGQMTNVTYYNSSLGADEVFAIYKDGPKGSNNILSVVPTWVYVIVALVIVGMVGYSLTS